MLAHEYIDLATGRDMQIRADLFERAPMVWLLLGLLFISLGLYLGFDHGLTFLYMLVGIFCSLYGPLLFVFKKRERPQHSSKRTLSRDFISAGSTVVMPMPDASEMAASEAAQRRTLDVAEAS